MQSGVHLSSTKMLNQEKILEVERYENEMRLRINSAFGEDCDLPKNREEWEKATEEWHNKSHPTDFLWSEEYYEKLKNSDLESIEVAILYLDVDPWYFRSGYLKERLIHGLRAATLKESHKQNLRNILWKICTGKNRREFSDFCSLALKISSNEFIQKLSKVTEKEDNEYCGKPKKMLSYLLKENLV